MTRTAWFHCFAGTAGDMTMGALVHAGADQLAVMEIVATLDVTGFALTFEPVLRCGIAATHALVVIDDTDHGHDHGHDHTHDHGHDLHAGRLGAPAPHDDRAAVVRRPAALSVADYDTRRDA